MDVSKSLAFGVLQSFIIIVRRMIFTSLIPFLLSETTVPAVDLIQPEEILNFVNDTEGSVTFSLVVIDSFDPDLRN